MSQSLLRTVPLLFFACGLLGLTIAAYPFYLPASRYGLAAMVLFAVLGYLRPYVGLVLWLFCIPWFSLAKWTGGMVIEEYDLALWGYCLGLIVYFLRVGLPTNIVNIKWHPAVLVLTLLAIVWQLALVVKGYQLLPPSSALFFTNYEDQGGPLRIAKAVFSAISFYLCCRYLSADWQRLEKSLVYGFSLGATGVVLGCLFERWHFTGLLNLTSDYRTTAWFWEMHTGGATLDAYLTLCLPFLLLGLFFSATTLKKMLFALLLAGYGYVVMTTFSRGVYISVPLVAVMFFAVHYIRGRLSIRLLPEDKRGVFALLAVALLATLCAVLLFPYGGYRVILAIFGLSLLLMLFASGVTTRNNNGLLMGMLIAVLLIMSFYSIAGIGKSVYIHYALCWGGGLVLLAGKRLGWNGIKVDILLGGSVMSLALISGAICWYWSDFSMTIQQLPALTILPLLAMTLLLPVKDSLKLTEFSAVSTWIGSVMLTMVIIMAINSSYIESRFSTTDQDLTSRFQHWQKAIKAMPEASDIWFGSGVGRFVALNRALGEQEDQVAQLKLIPLQHGTALYTKSGSHVHGYGELFRLTQQIARPTGDIELKLALRHSGNTRLLAEICDKQLLYHGKCARGTIFIKGASDGVAQYSIRFEKNPFTVSIRDSLMSKTFSLALNNREAEIVIESAELLDSHQQNLLQNSDFSQELRYWFFSSDRYHMPYHVKGLWPMQLFEMGLIGLLLWSLLSVVVCSLQLLSKRSFSLIGSSIAMSLLGLLLVGLFDSVIDGGRLAMVYLILILLAASIRPVNLEHVSRL